MGDALAQAGGSAVSDDLLFGFDDIQRWKRGELPSGWLDQRGKMLCLRLRQQCQTLAAMAGVPRSDVHSGAMRDPPEHIDDEIPWADPEIRTNYEAALGRLILAHNAVDRHLTLLIQRCLEHLNDPVELQKLTRGSFAQRLESLRMMAAISPSLRLEAVPFLELAELNGLRNIVAHGHFDQNPFQGDYELISNRKTHSDFSADRLDQIAERLNAASDTLKVSIWFWDDDVDSST